MKFPLVDTHFHLDLFDDAHELVKKFEAQKHFVIAVTNAPSVFEWTRQITQGHARIRPAIGLHPELIESHGHELDLFFDLLPQTRYVGEVGLDYTTSDKELRLRQRRAFERIVEKCDEAGDKVLTIHSRRAVPDVIDILQGFRGTAILHWFSGTVRQMEAASDAGIYFSVNSAMTKSSRARNLISRMSSNRVVTESDGPFVTIHGRPANSTDLEYVVADLAEIWRCSYEQAHERILCNLKRMVATQEFGGDNASQTAPCELENNPNIGNIGVAGERP